MTDKSDPLYQSTGSEKLSSTGAISVTPIDTVVVTKFLSNNNNPSLLNLIVDDIIHVLSKPSNSWWDGIIVDPIGEATRGWFPPSYTRHISSESTSENTSVSDTPNDTVLTATTVEDPLHHQSSIVTVQNSVYSSATPSQHQGSITTNFSVTSPSMTQQSSVNSNSTNPHTQNQSTSQIQVTSTEEIEAYFNPSVSGGHAFNFVPVWVPHVTEDNQFVYYNPKLNVYSRDLPMTSYPVLDMKSSLDFPSGSELNGIDSLPFKKIPDQISVSSADDQSSSHKNSVVNSDNASQVHFNANNRNTSFSAQVTTNTMEDSMVSNSNKLTSRMLYNPNLFYYDPSDITNWEQLSRTLKFLIKMCIDAVSKYSKQLFLAHLNNISKLVVIYQLATRLMMGELINNHAAELVSKLLKKITSALIQLTINGNLHLMGDKDAPHYLGSLELSEEHEEDSDDENMTSEIQKLQDPQEPDEEVTPHIDIASGTGTSISGSTTPSMPSRGRFKSYLPNTVRSTTPASSIRSEGSSSDAYLAQAERDATKLVRRALMIQDVFANIKLSNNGDSKSLPLVFPRFFKNRYDGGGWINPWEFKPEANHIEIDYDAIYNQMKGRNKNKVVLDDDIINILEKKKIEAANILNDVLDVLNTPIPKEVEMERFMEERNINVLTLVYHVVPIFNKFLDALGSIDFTVFAMILKLSEESKEKRLNENFLPNELSKLDNNLIDPSMGSSPGSMENLNSSANLTFTKTGTLVDDEKAKEAADLYAEDYMASSNSNSFFYEATSKVVTTGINEFLDAKQDLYSILSELVMDAQNLTVEDPEVFRGLKEEDALVYDKSIHELPAEKYANKLYQKLTSEDNSFLSDGICLYDTYLKLKKTIQQVFERFDVVMYSISQLKDQRQLILNYCSRLMNTDFTVASLFMAERHNTMVSSLTASEFYYDGHRRNSSMSSEESVSWFLDVDDDEKSLIYDANGIKGGPVAGLISKLVNPNDTDTNYIHTVLLNFKTFATATEFFQLLFDKFNTSMPEALTYDEYGIWLEKKLRPTQERILEVIELLFIRYWNVNYSSPELIAKWKAFSNDNSSQVPQDLMDAGLYLMSLTTQEQVYSVYGNGNPEVEASRDRTPVPLTVGKMLKKGKLTLKDVDSLELARQISIDQFKLYSNINQFELLSRSWNVRKYGSIGNSPGITAFIAHCNKLTHFTSYMILKRVDMRQRAEQIKYFILLAEKFLKLKNFSSMTAVISGLGSTQISRLKKTWALVPQHILDAFQKMDQLMSIGKNYNEYRYILRYVVSDDVPCLPFLGIFLSDLRFMADGNPDYLHGNKKLINLSKRVLITNTITEALKFVAIPYNFEVIPEIQDYLQEQFDACPDEDAMYEMSLKLEPRVSASTTVAQQQLKKSDDKHKHGNVNSRGFNPQYII